ncbi:MAG: RNA polymerase sigma factor [Gemmatimonadaceae bacterium]
MSADADRSLGRSRPAGASAGDGGRFAILQGKELRQRLIARDEQALVELIEVATPWLLGVTHAMLSDESDAEDVVMQTFSIAWNRIGIFRDDGWDLLPWLLRIARNRAIDRLRSRRRHQMKTKLIETLGGLDERVTPAPEPNEAAQPGWHVHETVKAAIGALPDDQRTAIRLAYFQGLTQSEIAEHLAIPLGTVKTRLRLAFDKLRVSLATVKDWNL